MALPAKPVAAIARVVAIGGIDPRGAAGVVRDFLTIRALGAHAYLVPTAHTAQNADAVHAVYPCPPDELRHMLRLALPQPPAGPAGVAVKVGMVATEALAAAVLEGLRGFAGPVVYDPVLAGSNGGALYQGAIQALLPLVARATLVTPNLAEAQALSGVTVTDIDSARTAAANLLALGAGAVLVKGGHLQPEARTADDLLVSGAGERRFSLPRVPHKDPRGTGCALASAIAVELARGRAVAEAVGLAKHWLHTRIAAARAVGDEHWL